MNIKREVGSEDDVKAAVVDLKKVIEEGEGGEADTIIFIGITCGLSAPYVAAQFDCIFTFYYCSFLIIFSFFFLCSFFFFSSFLSEIERR